MKANYVIKVLYPPRDSKEALEHDPAEILSSSERLSLANRLRAQLAKHTPSAQATAFIASLIAHLEDVHTETEMTRLDSSDLISVLENRTPGLLTNLIFLSRRYLEELRDAD